MAVRWSGKRRRETSDLGQEPMSGKELLTRSGIVAPLVRNVVLRVVPDVAAGVERTPHRLDRLRVDGAPADEERRPRRVLDECVQDCLGPLRGAVVERESDSALVRLEPLDDTER